MTHRSNSEYLIRWEYSGVVVETKDDAEGSTSFMAQILKNKNRLCFINFVLLIGIFSTSVRFTYTNKAKKFRYNFISKLKYTLLKSEISPNSNYIPHLLSVTKYHSNRDANISTQSLSSGNDFATEKINESGRMRAYFAPFSSRLR